ncbi:MAG: AAA family ATPase [Erysipelotrichaceae bacterium]|nr:AAA family ATPase [Erysipelotrichaceae bacterium]
MMNGLYVKSVRIDEKLDEGSYLSKIPAIRQLEGQPLNFEKQVSFFVGENGSGKSTLMEAVAIAMGFNPEGGTKNSSFSTDDTHSDLHEHIVISRSAYPKDGFFLRAESFYNFATTVNKLDAGGRVPLIDYYGGVSLHEQSHGESFLALVKNRFSGHGLYLLDEPEAALSPSRLMELLVLIHDLTKEDSQFIICTHSPILMSYPGADLFEFSERGIEKVEYKDTEHYRITKAFIDKAEVMYSHLFDREEE